MVTKLEQGDPWLGEPSVTKQRLEADSGMCAPRLWQYNITVFNQDNTDHQLASKQM